MIGFRIAEVKERVPADLIAKYHNIAVSHVSDCMSRLCGLGPGIRPLQTGKRTIMAGSAVTVRTRPGDNLLVYKALTMAGAGDVLVVDGGGDLSNALLGEIMFSLAVSRGLAGIVVNGAIRDSAWAKENALPIFCAGVCHRGPYRNGPGEINYPIAINGTVISPGDLVIGDDDGVVCVAREEAHPLQQRAIEKHEADQKQMREIADGTSNSKWIDDILSGNGVTFTS